MINVVKLSGALVKDPDLFDAQSGAFRAEFTVCVKGVRWDRASGCDTIDEVFARCVCWEDTAEHVATLTAGTVIRVEGELSQQVVTGKDRKPDRKTKVRALTVQVIRTPPEPRPDPVDDEFPVDF